VVQHPGHDVVGLDIWGKSVLKRVTLGVIIMGHVQSGIKYGSGFRRKMASSLYSLIYIHMPQLVRNGECGRESIVLDNGTRRVVVTHGSQFSQSQRVTLVEPRIPTNGFPILNSDISTKDQF